MTKTYNNVFIFEHDGSWMLSEDKSKKHAVSFSTKEEAIAFANKKTINEAIFIKTSKSNMENIKAQIKEHKQKIKSINKEKREYIKGVKLDISKLKKSIAIKSEFKSAKADFDKNISDASYKFDMQITEQNEAINKLMAYKRKWIVNIVPGSKRTFFKNERRNFNIVAIASFVAISLFLAYLITAIVLPFFGEYWLIYNVQYFGWPLWALLLMFIWVPSLFIGVNLLNKRKLTDFQLILERKKINRTAILIAIPTFGISLLAIFLSTSHYYDSKEFRKYIALDNKGANNQIWLKDERPITASAAATLGLSWLVIIMWSLVILFPIYKLIKQTFNGDLGTKLGSIGSYTFSFKHFKRLFDNYNYLDWMWNTLFISIITMVIIVVMATFASYIYSRNRFKTKKASLLMIMVLGLMPSTAAIVSYYILSVILNKTVGLDGRWLLIFLYAGGGVVGSIFNLKGYLDGISTELDDAATIDGASKLGIFFRIIFPLMKPMLPVIAIGAFVGPFGDYIMPQILFKDAHNWTLAQGLQHIQSADETAFAAGAIIIAVPITGVIALSQKLMVKNTMAGGVKG